MDTEIPLTEQRRRRVMRVVIALFVIGSMVGALALFGDWMRPTVDADEIRTAVVSSGPMLATLDAAGTVLPRYERVITSPVEARITEIHKRAGERVVTGTPILSMDVSATQSEVTRIDRQIAIRQNEMTRLRIQIEGELRTLEAQLEQKRLDAEMLAYRAAQEKRLQSAGLIAQEASKQSEVAARKAAIDVDQTERAIERLRRESVARFAGVQLDASLLQEERSEAAKQLQLAAAEATADGVVTWVTPEIGAMVQRGDPVARIAGTTAYRIEGTVADVHAAAVMPGIEVRVRAGNEILAGQVESVEPSVTNGAVRFHVALQRPDHPALRPNRRVDLELVTGQRNDAVQVERGQLLTHSQRYVWVVEGDRAVRRPVRVGLTAVDRVELLEGVRPGETVINSGLIGLGEPPVIRIR